MLTAVKAVKEFWVKFEKELEKDKLPPEIHLTIEVKFAEYLSTLLDRYLETCKTLGEKTAYEILISTLAKSETNLFKPTKE